MDKDTLDNLYKLYMADIYRYLFYLCKDKYMAEDLLQDTFFRAYLYLEDCPPDNVNHGYSGLPIMPSLIM